MNARCSSCQDLTSRVITEEEPGRQAEEALERWCEVPCRQSVQIEEWKHLAAPRGSAAGGGMIEDVNFAFSPVSSSALLSFTRGASMSIGPDPVATDRRRAWPFQTTKRWPSSSSSPARDCT